MLEPFLRVPGFDISRQRSGSRGSSAAAPRPGPARPRRRRRLKVTAPGWAPGSEPGHKLRGPGVRAAGGCSSRETSARPGAPDPRSLPAQPSPEPPAPPPSPPQSRTPAALAASAAAAAASRSRARSRGRAGPAPRAPRLCAPAPASVRAPAEHVGAGRGVPRGCVARPASGARGSQSRGRSSCFLRGPAGLPGTLQGEILFREGAHRGTPRPRPAQRAAGARRWGRWPPAAAAPRGGRDGASRARLPGISPHSRRGPAYGCGR